MKYCSTCGKEIVDEAVICPGCGCEVNDKKRSASDPMALASDGASSAKIFLILSIILLVLGALCWLFINMWIGVAMLLVAEFLALQPKSKVNSTAKKALSGLSKAEQKAKIKEIYRAVKKNNPVLSVCFAVAIIALILVIVAALFIRV